MTRRLSRWQEQRYTKLCKHSAERDNECSRREWHDFQEALIGHGLELGLLTSGITLRQNMAMIGTRSELFSLHSSCSGEYNESLRKGTKSTLLET